MYMRWIAEMKACGVLIKISNILGKISLRKLIPSTLMCENSTLFFLLCPVHNLKVSAGKVVD